MSAEGREPLGVQLHSVRHEAAHDLAGTLASLAAIGYRAVELAGYCGRTPAELRTALDGAGLTCTSAHIAAGRERPDRSLDDDPDLIAEDASILGFDTVVMPMFTLPERLDPTPLPGESMSAMVARLTGSISLSEWQAFIDYLNATGAALARRGLRFCYHNHDVEFAPLADGTILDQLLRGTDPSLVGFQLDVGWAASAGVAAGPLLMAHSGRFGSLHLRDVRASTASDAVLQQEPVEIGAGVIDWPSLLTAARVAGVQRFFIEQEEPFERPPLESIRICFDYLAQLAC